MISSYGLAVEESGGTNYSNFVIRSNSFALAGPASEGVHRTTLSTSAIRLRPTQLRYGFSVSADLNSAMMDYASVDTAHIKQLAVKSAQIDNAAVTTAKIGDLQVEH